MLLEVEEYGVMKATMLWNREKSSSLKVVLTDFIMSDEFLPDYSDEAFPLTHIFPANKALEKVVERHGPTLYARRIWPEPILNDEIF